MCADLIACSRCFLVDDYCDPGGNRTHDFFLRREALYPLSYRVNVERFYRITRSPACMYRGVMPSRERGSSRSARRTCRSPRRSAARSIHRGPWSRYPRSCREGGQSPAPQSCFRRSRRTGECRGIGRRARSAIPARICHNRPLSWRQERVRHTTSAPRRAGTQGRSSVVSLWCATETETRRRAWTARRLDKGGAASRRCEVAPAPRRRAFALVDAADDGAPCAAYGSLHNEPRTLRSPSRSRPKSNCHSACSRHRAPCSRGGRTGEPRCPPPRSRRKDEPEGIRSFAAGCPRASPPYSEGAGPSAPRASSGSTRARTLRSTHGTTTAASAHHAEPVETPQAASLRRISCTLA